MARISTPERLKPRIHAPTPLTAADANAISCVAPGMCLVPVSSQVRLLPNDNNLTPDSYQQLMAIGLQDHPCPPRHPV